MLTPDQDYADERTCVYKDETYSVRDNGAVRRHSREGRRLRKYDDVWTFGKQNPRNGYMYIGKARIHQIVATAFHGEPTDKNLVVDHKDSNRCNNRPENLHWVTRLENALNNPATRWKIEMICGSIEAYLENPSLLNEHTDADPNFSWMRTVSKEEGERALKNMENWAKKRQVPSGKGTMGEWVFQTDTEESEQPNSSQPFAVSTGQLPDRPVETSAKNAFVSDAEWEEYVSNVLAPKDTEVPKEHKERQQSNEEYSYPLPAPVIEEETPPLPPEPVITTSLTPNAVQKDWKTPTEFPCCPTNPDATLDDYFANLHAGVVFAKNHWGATIVLDTAKVDDSILVLGESDQDDAIKPWCLCRIVKEGQFVHENRGSFFEEKGGQKYFTLEQGLEWTGGDGIDDYC